MIKIDDVSILRLLPNFLQEDKGIKFLIQVIQEEMDLINIREKTLFIYGDFSRLNESVLDELAYQWRVEGYQQTFSKGIKASLVETAYIVRKTKGTKHAIESVVENIYSGAKIKEWFEYDGDPHHFKIDVGEFIVNKSEIEKLIAVIGTSKRESSKLDAIKFKFKSNTDIRVNNGLSFTSKQTINLLYKPGNFLIKNDEYGLFRTAFTYSSKNKFIKIVPNSIYRIIDNQGNFSLEKINEKGIPENGILKKVRGRLDFINPVSFPQTIEIIK